MPYAGSQSGTGFGAVLSIGPVVGTAAPTFVVIGEVEEASPNGRAWGEEDVTNFSSLGVDKEYKKTIRDPGKFKISYNLIPTDLGQIALVAAQESKQNFIFKLQLPPLGAQITTGDLWTFNAGVLSVDPTSITPEKFLKGACELRVSGPRTITAGA